MFGSIPRCRTSCQEALCPALSCCSGGCRLTAVGCEKFDFKRGLGGRWRLFAAGRMGLRRRRPRCVTQPAVWLRCRLVAWPCLLRRWWQLQNSVERCVQGGDGMARDRLAQALRGVAAVVPAWLGGYHLLFLEPWNDACSLSVCRAEPYRHRRVILIIEFRYVFVEQQRRGRGGEGPVWGR